MAIEDKTLEKHVAVDKEWVGRTKDYKEEKEDWLLLAVLGSLGTENDKIKVLNSWLKADVRESGTCCVCQKYLLQQQDWHS